MLKSSERSIISRLQQQNLDLAIYLLLTLFNLFLGGYLIYKTQVDIAGDTLQYISMANLLVGKSGDLFYYRSWGYPIFIISTGYPWLHRPIIVQLIQVILGSAVPYLVGSSLRKLAVASWICVSAAIACFISFSSMIFSATLLSDSYSEFLFYFSIWVVACALAKAERSTQWRTLWMFAAAIGVLFFSLYLTRPANVFLGFVGLGAGAIFGPKVCRNLMLGAIFWLLLLIVAWMPLQRGWTAWVEVKSKQTYQTDGSIAGLMFFWNIYSTGATLVGKSTIGPENGPCSSSIYKSVQKNVESIRHAVYGKAIGADKVFAEHTLLNHFIIWKSIEHDYEPKRMDRVFWCAALEGIYAEPKSLLYVYDGLVSFFLISDVIYNDGRRQAWPSIEQYPTVNGSVLGGWTLYIGTVVKVVSFLVALITLIPALRLGYPARIFVIIVWSMVLYLAAVDITFAAPHWRYTSAVIPALLLLAGVGLSALIEQDHKQLIRASSSM
jgi:hypothetical protein